MSSIDEKIPGLKVNYFIIFLSGMVLFIGSILIFMLIIQQVFGRYDLRQILPTSNNLSMLFEDDAKIAILYSQYTEIYLPEGSTWISDNVSTWETFARSNKLNTVVLTDQDIELGNHFKYTLLVLPGAKALSDKEVVQIKKFIERGGSVFASSGTGNMSNEGKWKGWQFFTEVFGLDFTKEIKPEETYRRHTLRGNIPLTAGIPTGYPLKVATWDRPMYAEILEPRANQASFWYDYRREAGLVRDEIKKSAGIAYGTYGEGRYVWMGFELNSVIGNTEDYVYFDKLFRNCVDYLLYRPTVFIHDWPSPYQAAAIFTPIVDEQPSNIRNLAGIINSANIPATIFVDPYADGASAQILRSLAPSADFAVIADIGFKETMSDTLNKLYKQDAQISVLTAAKDSLEKIVGEEVVGLKPRYHFFDERTMQALSLSDYLFIISDSLTDRSVPRLEIRDENPLIILKKTSRNDYDVVRDFGLHEPEFQAYTYEEDIDRILFEGGLYVLQLHTSYQLRPNYIGVVQELAKYMRNKKMWVTSIKELNDWWIKRGRIEIKYEVRSARRFMCEVTNPAEIETKDVLVQINLNKKIENMKITSEIIGTPLPEWEFKKKEQLITLYFPILLSGESRSYLLDFDMVGEQTVELF